MGTEVTDMHSYKPQAILTLQRENDSAKIRDGHVGILGALIGCVKVDMKDFQQYSSLIIRRYYLMKTNELCAWETA